MSSDSIKRLQEGEWRWLLNSEDEDGSFQFDCSACGCCCRGEITIHLNLWDLQRMAGYLEYETCAELFSNGIVEEITLEAGGFRPAIRFKENLNTQFCPFLENRLEDNGELLGLCKLHPDLKPMVCKLAPVGRELDLEESGESTVQWLFTEPVSGCPGCRVPQSNLLDHWIAPHHKELELEVAYFHVMERLLTAGAKMERFREFHCDLTVVESVEDYLTRWAVKR